MDAVNNSMPKRPRWIWVISIFYLFSTGWTLLSLLMYSAGNLSFSSSQNAYFSSLSSFDYFIMILTMLINISGAITLFFLRRIAYYFFSKNLALIIITSFWHAVSKNFFEAFGLGGIFGTAIGWIIFAQVCFYSQKLIQRGVLR